MLEEICRLENAASENPIAGSAHGETIRLPMEKWRVGTIKSTGVPRKLDGLGRIVIPIEIQNTLKIAKKDSNFTRRR